MTVILEDGGGEAADMGRTDVDVAWGAELSGVDWSANEELEYAGRYLCALAQHGCRSFVSNAHATEVGVAILGGVMPVPLTRPAAGRTLARGSYTSSCFSHYVHYLFDEIWLLARGRLLAPALAGRSQVRQLLLRAALLLLVGPLLALLALLWSGLARCCGLDACVYLNNWLLSTSLQPRLPPRGALRAQLDALTAALCASHPRHALVYRCVDARGGGALLRALEQRGWRRVPARYVHYQPAGDAALWRRPAVKADLRLERARLVACGEGGEHAWRPLAADAPVSDALAARVVELYELLYMHKYSGCNPAFTPRFVQRAVALRLLSVWLLEHAPSGEVVGVLGYYVRAGYLTTPLFGYDTRLPAALGLYRLLSLRVLQESRRLGVAAHASGGAADFKRQRGAASVVECCLVYTAHLPLRRRLAWAPLRLACAALARLGVFGAAPDPEAELDTSRLEPNPSGRLRPGPPE